MHGSLDPDEKVMAESEAQLENHLAAKRKAIAVCNQGVVSKLYDVIAELGWDCYDNVAVEIGGTSVYGIDGAGTKWAPLKGTRKYNKDAFIVIKNLDRNPVVPSKAPIESENADNQVDEGQKLSNIVQVRIEHLL